MFFRNLSFFILLTVFSINCMEKKGEIIPGERENLGDLANLTDDVILELVRASINWGAKTPQAALKPAEQFLNTNKYMREVIKPVFYRTKGVKELKEKVDNIIALKKYENVFKEVIKKSLGLDSQATAAIVQPDKKIILAGYLTDDSLDKFALVRYNIDGSLDSSFGTNGIAIKDVIGGAISIALQKDGKIVVLGLREVGDLFDSLLLKYNKDGLLDKLFGQSGVVKLKFPNNLKSPVAQDMTLQPDGKILISVSATTVSPRGSVTNKLFKFRYNADGTLDNTFIAE